MLKIGSKLLCKFDYQDVLISGVEYTIRSGFGPNGNGNLFINDLWLSQGVYNKYFYTEKEYRKLKLERLNENVG